MEENQIQTELDSVAESSQEPEIADNSGVIQNEEVCQEEEVIQETGESLPKDPVEELILGKFKSVEDLAKAYEELQRHQGQNSEELGTLRKELNLFNNLKKDLEQVEKLKNTFIEAINNDLSKYNSPEYLQNPNFVNIYTQALAAFQGELDTDKFVEMIDSYVDSRIRANEIKKTAHSETQSLINKMTYSKNSQTKFNSPKKRFDEMSPKEIDELLDKLI